MDLQKVVTSLLQASPDLNLSKWVRGVDHTASRVGLLLCGDLDTACRLVKDDPNPTSKATPKERIKELVLYNIHPNHFAVRKELGIDIGG